jgi:hypothetical protein
MKKHNLLPDDDDEPTELSPSTLKVVKPTISPVKVKVEKIGNEAILCMFLVFSSMKIVFSLMKMTLYLLRIRTYILRFNAYMSVKDIIKRHN